MSRRKGKKVGVAAEGPLLPPPIPPNNINNTTQVLRKVLERLDFESLSTCRLVCKLWKEQVGDLFESEGAVRMDMRLPPIRRLLTPLTLEGPSTSKGQGTREDDLEGDILKELERLKLPRRNLAFYPNRAWDLQTLFSEVKTREVQRMRLHMIDYKRPVVEELERVEGKRRKVEGQGRPPLVLPNLEELIIDSKFNEECLELTLPKDFSLDLPKLRSLAICHKSVDLDMDVFLTGMRPSSNWISGLRVLKIDVQTLCINPAQVEELENMDLQLNTLELSVLRIEGHRLHNRLRENRFILADLIGCMSETLEVLRITAKSSTPPTRSCCGGYLRPSGDMTRPILDLEEVTMNKLRVLELTGGVEVGKIQIILKKLPTLTTCILNCKSEDGSVFVGVDKKSTFPLIREFQYPRTYSSTIIPKNTLRLFQNLTRLTLTIDHENILWELISVLKGSCIQYLKMIIKDQKPLLVGESRYSTDEHRPANMENLFQDWKYLREVVFSKGDRIDFVDGLMRGKYVSRRKRERYAKGEDFSGPSTPLAVFKRLYIKRFISANIEKVQLVNFGPAPIKMASVEDLVLQSPNLRRLTLKNCNICDADYRLMGRREVLDRISKLELANSEFKVELELNFEKSIKTELNTPQSKRQKSKPSPSHPAMMKVDVLKMIFGVLDFDSLLNCRGVCRSWRESSEFAFMSKGRFILPSKENQAWKCKSMERRKKEQIEYETKLLKQISELKFPIKNISINPLQLSDPPKFLKDAGLAEKLKSVKLNFTGDYKIPTDSDSSSDADSDSDNSSIKVQDPISQVDFPKLEEIVLAGNPLEYVRFSPKSGFSIPKLHRVSIEKPPMDMEDYVDRSGDRNDFIDIDVLIERLKLRPGVARALTYLNINGGSLKINTENVQELMDFNWKLHHLELRHLEIFQMAGHNDDDDDDIENQTIHSLSPLIEKMSETLEVLILSGRFPISGWNYNYNSAYKRLHPPEGPNLCSLQFLSEMQNLRVLEFHGAIEVGHIEDILIQLPQLKKCVFNCKKDWKEDFFRPLGSEVTFPNIREFQYPRNIYCESILVRTVQLFPNLVKLTLMVAHEKYLWSLASSELSNLTSLRELTLLIKDAPNGSFENGHQVVRSCTPEERPKLTTRIFHHWKALEKLKFWKTGMQDYRGKKILAPLQFFNYSTEKDKLYTSTLMIFEEFPIQGLISDNISSLELLDFTAAPIRIQSLEKLLLGSPSLRSISLKDCVVCGDDGRILNREELLESLSQINGDIKLEIQVLSKCELIHPGN